MVPRSSSLANGSLPRRMLSSIVCWGTSVTARNTAATAKPSRPPICSAITSQIPHRIASETLIPMTGRIGSERSNPLTAISVRTCSTTSPTPRIARPTSVISDRAGADSTKASQIASVAASTPVNTRINRTRPVVMIPASALRSPRSKVAIDHLRYLHQLVINSLLGGTVFLVKPLRAHGTNE